MLGSNDMFQFPNQEGPLAWFVLFLRLVCVVHNLRTEPLVLPFQAQMLRSTVTGGVVRRWMKRRTDRRNGEKLVELCRPLQVKPTTAGRVAPRPEQTKPWEQIPG